MISKQFPPRYLLTTTGIKNINDVTIGEKVYEWRTSIPLEIKDIQYLTFNTMYELTYSDGRQDYITSNESIYLDQSIQPPHTPFCKCLKTKDFPIKLYPTIFNNINSVLDPDPYTTGSLLIHGDYTNDENMNYPFNRTEVNNQLSHMYHLDYESFNDSKVYFKYRGDPSNHRITWKEFFKHTTFNNSIPNEYLYGSIKDRIQFIKGAFDSGYDNESPNVAMFHTDINKINIVRFVLNSLGISSFVYESNNRYGLEVTGLPSSWPGFFYDYEYIVKMINRSIGINFDEHHCNNSTVTLVNIRPISCDRYTRNSIPYIILEHPNMVYTSPCYLPMISL